MANAQAAINTVLDEHDAALAQAAQRCLMAALDHSRAETIRLIAQGEDNAEAVVELPPKYCALWPTCLASWLSVSP